MSARYEELANKYKMGWITDSTLRGWVALNQKRAGFGITEEEYKTITGKEYDV